MVGSLFFPNELIDKIVELLLAGKSHEPSNRKFATIAPLTLASSRLREIALRRFFSSLCPSSSYHWTQLHKILISQGEQAFAWVRQIHAVAEVLSSNPIRLHSLPNLQTLIISFSQTGVATQQTLMKKIIKLPQPYLSNPPSPIGSPLHAPRALLRVTSLTLTALSYIDKTLLMMVAKNFPNLTYLYLSCTDRLDLDCCRGCFQDSASCAIGISPIPDMFTDVGHLANTFATALKPLDKLTYLHLGIFLSNESLFNAHFSHIDDDFSHHSDDRDITFGPEACAMCRTVEAVGTVRQCELVATKIMAKRLKSLRSIGWSTVFTNTQDHQPHSDNKMGDPARSTTRWVLREEGKLHLRKKPW